MVELDTLTEAAEEPPRYGPRVALALEPSSQIHLGLRTTGSSSGLEVVLYFTPTTTTSTALPGNLSIISSYSFTRYAPQELAIAFLRQLPPSIPQNPEIERLIRQGGKESFGVSYDGGYRLAIHDTLREFHSSQ